jgi:hypothetical protein
MELPLATASANAAVSTDGAATASWLPKPRLVTFDTLAEALRSSAQKRARAAENAVNLSHVHGHHSEDDSALDACL